MGAARLERVQGLGASPPFGALELTVRVPQLASNGGANTMAWPASKLRIRLLYFGTFVLCSVSLLLSQRLSGLSRERCALTYKPLCHPFGADFARLNPSVRGPRS